MYNNLANEIINLKYKDMLTVGNVARLKKIHGCKDVDIALACVNNNVEKLKEYIQRGYDISICNDSILRFTVSEGYVEISKLLLKNGVEVD